MPPKYFAFIDGEQRGPFTLDQLTDVGVHPSTYVWCKDMDDWQRADSVEEIRNLFRHHIERKKEIEPAAPAAAPVETVKPEEVSNEASGARPGRFGRFGVQLPEMEENIDLNTPPQVSMTLAVLSLLLCFPLTGLVAVFYTYKAQKTWDEATKWGGAKGKDSEGLRRKAHEYERLSKMWLGLTVAFGVIFWTLIFSIPK